jgi:aminoglycoside phosphotransferase (APT) family kinase protein
MALNNIIDPTTARPKLERWYAQRHPGAHNVRIDNIQIPHANGMSSETVLFDITWTEGGQQHEQGLVARVAPTAGGLFPTYDLAFEQRVIDAVGASTRVPVPTTFGVEEDNSVLGAPFLIMQRLHGRVPSDDPPFTAEGWVHDLPVEKQAALYDNALAAMAAINAADISTLGAETVGHPDRGTSSLRQQLEHYEQLYAWIAAGRAHPVVDAALAWAHPNLPTAEAPAGLSWGDARIGNMMFGDKLEVTAVLDWEMASIGEAELDFAWFLFLNRNHSEGLGLPPLPGFPTREHSISRYEQLLGRPLVNLHFHEVFAALRATIIMMRVGSILIDAGLLPADARMPIVNPASQLLATILELPSPSADAVWITGNR